MSKIVVSQCDNEMIGVATVWSNSYQIFDIKSGNGNSVNVTIELVNGPYNGPLELNGVNGPLSGTHKVQIPESKVNIALMGICWGGRADFKVSVDGGTPYEYHNDGKALVVGLGDPLENNALAAAEVSLD